MKNCEPIERLLEFVPNEDIKEKYICSYLLKAFQDSGLDPKMCRSQTFDSAGNMSGKRKRAAAQFCLKTENEKAVYFVQGVYCFTGFEHDKYNAVSCNVL